MLDKIKNAFGNIKAKFSKNSNVKVEEEHSETDGMMSIDDYFDSSGPISNNLGEEEKKSDASSTIKKGIEAAKSFISETDYNPFADQEIVKEVDKKEFKDRWFVLLIKGLVTLIMIFLAALCFLMIYKLCYGLLHNTDTSSIGEYTDFLVPEDNLAPSINENDLIIVKKQLAYEEGDIILYEYAGTSHKIGKIVDVIRGNYIINDNNIKTDDYGSKIDENLVVGKEIKTIKNFKGYYDFITSPIAIILLVTIIALYFYLMSKGKVKDKELV